MSAIMTFFTFTSGCKSAHACKKLLSVCRWYSSGNTWTRIGGTAKLLTNLPEQHMINLFSALLTSTARHIYIYTTDTIHSPAVKGLNVFEFTWNLILHGIRHGRCWTDRWHTGKMLEQDADKTGLTTTGALRAALSCEGKARVQTYEWQTMFD